MGGNNAVAREDYGKLLHAIDQHVGRRLRMRRLLLGMTQAQVAEACGLVFQQLQKYECGSNRIGAGRLYQCARLLCVDVAWFYQDMAPELRQSISIPGFGEGAQESLAGGPNVVLAEIVFDRDLIGLIRTYNQIADPRQKESVRRLMETLAATSKPITG